jgi:hypothetical protein
MGKRHCSAWAQNLRLTSAEYANVKALLKKNDEQFELYVQTRVRVRGIFRAALHMRRFDALHHRLWLIQYYDAWQTLAWRPEA